MWTVIPKKEAAGACSQTAGKNQLINEWPLAYGIETAIITNLRYGMFLECDMNNMYWCKIKNAQMHFYEQLFVEEFIFLTRSDIFLLLSSREKLK